MLLEKKRSLVLLVDLQLKLMPDMCFGTGDDDLFMALWPGGEQALGPAGIEGGFLYRVIGICLDIGFERADLVRAMFGGDNRHIHQVGQLGQSQCE